ncbi:MAG: polysaccharide biosynthesis tyrosine autokinase [Methylococcales bacterium]|nr:polysaccharide biosynthesis tyrosine autokinase [Methylococcales bacterium]
MELPQTPEQDFLLERQMNSSNVIKKMVAIDDIVYQQTPVITIDRQVLLDNRVVAAIEDDPRADVFRILRTKVLQRMRANNATVLAITSPTKGVGKSFVAVNLAASIAMDSNYSVLLVDMDLRRPSVHQYFGLTPKFGLSDYCLDNKPVAELLINPGIKSLVILPAGKPTKRSSELLSSAKMLAFSEELKCRYPNRIVIIDLPPLLLTDDAMAFMANVDACILVAAEGQTNKEELERSLQLIDKKKYLGTILNKSTENKDDDYY